MEPQTAFVGADCGVELDTESTVDLDLALIVHPGNPELNETLRLHNAVDDAGFDQLRFLFHDGLEGFENFLDRLNEFRLAAVSFFHGFQNMKEIFVCQCHGDCLLLFQECLYYTLK